MDYEFFMKKALDQAKNAFLAGEFPVGCVIVYQKRILSTGARKGTTGDTPNEIDHAEMIALRHLTDMKINRNQKGFTLFTTMEPCLMCLGALILGGVSKIVYAYEDVMGGALSCDLTRLSPLYQDRRISVVPNVLRKESLALFKAFFNDSKNSYWQGSLLAQYTLSRR